MSGKDQFRIPTPIYGPTYDLVAQAPASWAMAAWNIDRMRSITKGEGVTVAVLDTGIDRNHPDFEGRVDDAAGFTNEGPNDGHGHGTHCLGTVGSKESGIGVAQGCRLLSGKVLSNSGSGSDSQIAAGIDWAIGKGAHIISMSLGSSSPAPGILAAIKRANAKNVWVIAAAGNEGQGGVGWPGRYEECISVAAIDKNFKVAGFSSRGEKLDISGPGVQIVSAKPGGGYQEMSGTSMATPFIAGFLALYRGALTKKNLPVPDVFQLRKTLAFRAADLGAPGDDPDYGPGWMSPVMIELGLEADPPPVQ